MLGNDHSLGKRRGYDISYSTRLHTAGFRCLSLNGSNDTRALVGRGAARSRLSAGGRFRRMPEPALQALGNTVPVKFAQAVAEHLSAIPRGQETEAVERRAAMYCG